MTRLETFVAPLVELPTWKQIEKVNDLVNVLPFVRDEPGRDRWQSPDETLVRLAGDCEDKAILKMFALEALGFAWENLALVYGFNDKGAHVVLLVMDEWVLDSDEVEVLETSRSPFRPWRFMYVDPGRKHRAGYYQAVNWADDRERAALGENIYRQWSDLVERVCS